MKRFLLLLAALCFQSSVALESAIFAAVAQIPQSHPALLAVSITALKTGGADLLAQRMSATRTRGGHVVTRVDKRRVVTFAAYGAIYLGWFQHYLFSHVYTKLFPAAQSFATKTLAQKLTDTVGASHVLKQVSVEAFMHHPLLFVPALILLQEFVEPHFNFRRLAYNIRTKWSSDLLMCWSVWIPAALFNFSMVPVQYQVPFTTCVSFCYFVYVSLKKGVGAH